MIHSTQALGLPSPLFPFPLFFSRLLPNNGSTPFVPLAGGYAILKEMNSGACSLLFFSFFPSLFPFPLPCFIPPPCFFFFVHRGWFTPKETHPRCPLFFFPLVAFGSLFNARRAAKLSPSLTLLHGTAVGTKVIHPVILSPCRDSSVP